MDASPSTDTVGRDYRRLDSAHLVTTADALQRRIAARFPASGLSRVASELAQACRDGAELERWLARPNWLLRGVTLFGSLLFVVLIGAALSRLDVRWSVGALSELLQALESGVNDLVFLGVAIYFVATWERRKKRARVLRALHVLRALAHIVDMHQLTKDPEFAPTRGSTTAASPVRTLSAFELTRYLDYCSESLSLISKVAALYAQPFDDAPALAAVKEIEDLTNGLSRKIWQKIMILDRRMSPGPG
jgi:hypothetical protein